MFCLSDGEAIMMLAFFVWIQYRSVTDGQTDEHSSSGYTSACIARYAKALVNSIANTNTNIYLEKKLLQYSSNTETRKFSKADKPVR